MKKIATINECFSDNIGDQAISIAMSNLCEYIGYEQVDKYDYSFRDGSLQTAEQVRTKKSKLTPPKLFLLRKIMFFLRNIRKANRIAKKKYGVVIIGGGQLVLSNYSFSISMLLFMFFFKVYGTKVYIVSVGVGEDFKFFDRLLFKLSLKYADKLYVRDHSSQSRIRKIFGLEADYFPDIAYYLKPIKKSKSKYPSIVCPISYKVFTRYRKENGESYLSEKEYKNLWIDIIRKELEVKKNSKIVITATTTEDLNFSLSLKPFLSKSEIESIDFIESRTYHDFVNILSYSLSIVSGRMHALILAHINGLDVAPFIVSKKIENFSKEYLSKNVAEIAFEISKKSGELK